MADSCYACHLSSASVIIARKLVHILLLSLKVCALGDSARPLFARHAGRKHPFDARMPVLGNISRGGLRMAKNLSNAARKRIPMTSKMGNKNFYKGKGGTKEGHLNSKGIVM